MATRRPVKHPYAEIYTQSRWVPALILAWVHGRSSDPDGWFAEVVINSINAPGHAIELMVSQADIRPARMQ